jgi:hypothetical protein
MGHADYLRNGDWNSICDACGHKYKFSTLRLRWDGLWVCSYDFEIRQPQDYLRGIPDNMSVPVARPQAPDTFTVITATYPLTNGFAVDTLTLG